MTNPSFEQIQQVFNQTLSLDEPDFEQLLQLYAQFEQQLKLLEGEMSQADLLAYQVWFKQVIPKLEQLKSTMAAQLGQVQQGKKALDFYQNRISPKR